MATLKDLFLNELADIYDAENRLARALPEIAEAAEAEELMTALNEHLTKTEGHAEKIEEVFTAFDEKARRKECKAMRGLLEEARELMTANAGDVTIDAALISACQKVEHYEIASYGCLIEWARLLENTEAVNLLEDILAEEKAASAKLTALAEELNPVALEDEDSDDDAITSTKRVTGKPSN